MAKTRIIYSCQGCGNTSHKWLGRCPDCGGWNTFLEERAAPEKKSTARMESGSPPQPIPHLNITEEDRGRTGIAELDRVLGGGMVPGSAILIGGDPGIGKSALLLQAMGALAAKGVKVLYVTGEESSRQIRLRGERLGAVSELLLVYPETSVERILDAVKKTNPGVIVIDSVQTIFSEALESSPGSVSQVREISARLTGLAGGRGGAASPV